MSFSTFISAQQLANFIGNPAWRVVDCRFYLDNTPQGQNEYLQSHIPGASYVHLDDDLSSQVIPGKTGRHPLPSIDAMAKRFSNWGINSDTQVIVYDQGAGMIAARLWWMLQRMGHSQVAVLDGGFAAWHAQGLPLTQDINLPDVQMFPAKSRAELEANVTDVLACINQPDCRLLDARAADRFRGENESIDPIAGHIPSAISMPFMENLGENGCILPKPSLRERYLAVLDDVPADNAIVYCGSGVTAAHDVLAMVHAGLGFPRLYVGSWSHWITDSTRPIAIGQT